MKKNTKLIVAIILAIAIIGVIIGLIVYVSNEKKEVTVYDFSRTIEYSDKSNYALTSNDLVAATVLAADVRDDYVTDPADAIGKYIKGTCYKGSHILKGQIQKDPTYIEKNGVSELADYRKFYVSVDYGQAFAGDIKAGQLVDLLFEESDQGLPTDRTEHLVGSEYGIEYAQAKIFMQSVPIYQVYTADGSIYTPKKTAPNTSEDSSDASKGAPAYVALTVTVEQYEELKARMKFGNISLVSRFDESEDVESNGYLAIKGYGATRDANIYIGEGNLEYDPQIPMDNEENLEWDDHKSGMNGIAEIEPEEETEEAETQESLYSLFGRIQKVSMSDTQRTSFRSLYQQYKDYMKAYLGDDWADNLPEAVTVEMLRKSLGDDEDSVNKFNTFLEETGDLAKEVLGEDVELPW